MRATVQTLRTLDRLSDERGHPFDATLVVNMLRSGANHTKLAVATLPQYGFPVARTQIGHRTAFENASSEGTVAWRMSQTDAKAVKEITTLCTELAAAIAAPPVASKKAA